MFNRVAVALSALVLGVSCSEERPCREDAQCEAGDVCVFINPDDDVGACGQGSEGGADAIEAYLNLKLVTTAML